MFATFISFNKNYLISRVDVCTVLQQQLNNLFTILLAGHMKRSKSILKGKFNTVTIKAIGLLFCVWKRIPSLFTIKSHTLN